MRTPRRIASIAALLSMGLLTLPAFAAPPVATGGAGPSAAQVLKDREFAKTPEFAESQKLIGQAGELMRQEKYDEAIALDLKALAIREKAVPDTLWVSMVHSHIMEICQHSRDWKRALPYAERRVKIEEKRGVPDNQRLILHWEFASWLLNAGEYARAVVEYEAAIVIAEKIDGHRDGRSTHFLTSYGNALAKLRRWDDAETALLRSIRICETVENNEGLTYKLGALGTLYNEMGLYTKAEVVRERALTVAANARYGRDSATDEMQNLALTKIALEDYPAAERLLDEALSFTRARGEKTHFFAFDLALRARLDVATGAYDRAEPMLSRSLGLLNTLGPSGQKDVDKAVPGAVADAENMLGIVAMNKGDYRRAEGLLTKHLAYAEKANGPRSREVAGASAYLAELYFKAKRFDRAEGFATRAISIRDEVLFPKHPARGDSRAQVGRIREAKGDAAGAKKFYDDALKIREQSFGPEHPYVGRSLLDLADLARRQGKLQESEDLYKRALAIFEKAFGPMHEKVAATLEGLAALYVKTGKIELAVKLTAHSADIRERQASLLMAGGSEAQKRAFIMTLRAGTDFVTSLHTRYAPSDEAAKRLALTTIFQRKGRVLDVMAGSLSAIRSRIAEKDTALFDELSKARAEVARLALRGPAGAPLEEFKKELAAKEEKARAIEEKLGAQSDAFRAEDTPVTIERVQALIPDGMVLVELSVYSPRSSADIEIDAREGPSRVAAYVLDPKGKVSYVDLGESAPIEAAVKEMRAALSDPKGDPKKAARAVDALVTQKIRPLVPGKTRWLISADGALSLIPFAALVDEGGKYLVETHELTYLTSGRDLVRLTRAAPQGGGPLVVANPAFGRREEGESALALLEGGKDGSKERGAQTRGLDKAFFPPLPATAAEARAISGVLPSATVRMDVDATEAALKKARSPRVLHVATHGFFLDAKAPAPAPPKDEVVRANAKPKKEERGLELDDSPDWLPDDPLLRSGLALAGANAKKGGEGEDGVLTALEASSLDLRGTKLVVLSACETGLGDILRGEGVVGLRRALFIAGAQTLLASLWQVSDEETKTMMVGYYGRIMKGAGRSAALRDVQLAMLGQADTSHPYYWASFGVFGDPAPIGALEEQKEPEAAPAVTKPKGSGVSIAVKPGVRGCACSLGAMDSEAGAIAAAISLLALAGRRRSRNSSRKTTPTPRSGAC